MAPARSALIALLIAGLCASPGRADDPDAWLAMAIRRDLDETQPASVAFAWYLRAAEAGLPEAEFNVAIMLDSGRGVAKDLTAAATWYARAAAHGESRAAYNLGQLYAAGEGVPKNAALARAWFVASNLAAARPHLDALATEVAVSASTPPDPVAPGEGAVTRAGASTVEFVWTGRPQGGAADYFVELRRLDRTGSREVFSGFTTTSSLIAPLPRVGGHYAWRVSALVRRDAFYTTSNWVMFTVGLGDEPRSEPPTLSAR